ncbi:MAG: glutaredoxin family protein [Planctomycetes bacterium]|nr:glutaredoxin family protein [Planctomycetota bacterium]
MEIKHIDGKNKGKVMLYTLSTCIWCRKVKDLLGQLGVEYSYVDVDLLGESEKSKTVDTIKKWNPSCSFPTMVINEKKCIVGFAEDEIKTELGK